MLCNRVDITVKYFHQTEQYYSSTNMEMFENGTGRNHLSELSFSRKTTEMVQRYSNQREKKIHLKVLLLT